MVATKQTAYKHPLLNTLNQLGPLRLMLSLLAIIAIGLTPQPGTLPVYTGWELFHTLIIPVMAPLVFMGLMLDTLMSGVFIIDKQGAERKRYITAIVVNVLLAVVIVIRWLPYFQALGK